MKNKIVNNKITSYYDVNKHMFRKKSTMLSYKLFDYTGDYQLQY